MQWPIGCLQPVGSRDASKCKLAPACQDFKIDCHINGGCLHSRWLWSERGERSLALFTLIIIEYIGVLSIRKSFGLREELLGAASVVETSLHNFVELVRTIASSYSWVERFECPLEFAYKFIVRRIRILRNPPIEFHSCKRGRGKCQ